MGWQNRGQTFAFRYGAYSAGRDAKKGASRLSKKL